MGTASGGGPLGRPWVRIPLRQNGGHAINGDLALWPALWLCV